jgi:Zinc dependent phospholipase C
MTGFPRLNRFGMALLLAVIFYLPKAAAYSVLTHEELIDLAWNDSIRPLLLARFPGATDDQLREAHAYAYGGSAIQDMGYYPFSKHFFSDLTHYVRSGDLVGWLFRNAHTIDEYAFAIGALSHYLGDTIGHSEAVNPATAVEFPSLRKKFGPAVTYDQSPHGHVRTEFAFDIDELSDRAFAPPAYLRFIGLQVPQGFLERAFINTYGFELEELFGRGRTRPALRSYRTSVRSFIPAFAEAELVLHGHKFPPDPDDETHRILAERVAQTNYERHWAHTFRGPGFRAHLLAALVFIVPKIGDASDLAIKIPNLDTDDWYVRSLNHTVDIFRETLHRMATDPGEPDALPNLDLDTGKPIELGDYPLTDKTYAALLKRLTSKPDRIIPKDLKQNILDYYADIEATSPSAKQITTQLNILNGMKVADGLK